MNGWIKLHRKLLDNPTLRRPAYRALWIEILLRADHSGNAKVMFRGQSVALKPGQFTAGAYQLAEATGVPRGTVERVLARFASEEMIEEQKSNKCTLITVLKWSQYQIHEEQNEEPVRNKRGTSEEQVRTKQEAKNERMKESDPILATPSAVAEKVPNPINEILEMFQMKVNPTINYGNSTQRGAVEYLLKLMGKEKLSRMIDFVESIKSEEFAPTITTPYQLKEKLAALTSYYQKKHNKPSNVVSV